MNVKKIMFTFFLAKPLFKKIVYSLLIFILKLLPENRNTTALSFSTVKKVVVINAVNLGDASVVYLSAMVNVTDVATTKTGDQFLHLGARNPTVPGTFTFFAARVFARITASGVNFGLSN